MKGVHGGSYREIRSGKTYANGAWHDLTSGKSRKSGAWREVCNFTAPSGGGGPTGGTTSPVTLSISPSPFAATGRSATPSRILTATPSGGKSPYSYAWSLTYTSGGVILSATNTASITVSGPDGATCTVKCVCTDSIGSSGSATSQGTFTSLDIDVTSRF